MKDISVALKNILDYGRENDPEDKAMIAVLLLLMTGENNFATINISANQPNESL